MSTSPLPLPSSPWGRKNGGAPHRVFPNPTPNHPRSPTSLSLQLSFICDKSSSQVLGEESRIHTDFHSSVSSLPASQPPVLFIRSNLLPDVDPLAGAQIYHTQLPTPPWILQPQLKSCADKGGTAPPQASLVALHVRQQSVLSGSLPGMSPPPHLHPPTQNYQTFRDHFYVFTVSELLQLSEHGRWSKVAGDFIQKPPKVCKSGMVLYELLKFDTFRQDLFENPVLYVRVCGHMPVCAHAKEMV